MKKTLFDHYFLAMEFKTNPKIKNNSLQIKMRVYSFLLSLILALSFNSVNATYYYISNSGNDSDPGTSESFPWRSLAKINSFTPSPGDQILFKRGDEWYGTLTLNASGSSGNPIVYGAYGEGPDPVISGFTAITSGWTNEGGGIYSKVITSESQTNMVTINGINTGIGRYPNKGDAYLTYESFNSNVSITDNQLVGTPDWTGAELIKRPNDWSWERCKITNHSGTTINYTNPLSSYTGSKGNGYFIQNDLRTLDQFGEWYHNTSSGKFYMYFGNSTPSSYTVKVATKNSLITNPGYKFVTIKDLDILGSIQNAVYNNTLSNNFTVQNCNISFAGDYGVYINSQNGLVDKNIVHDCNQGAVRGMSDLIVITNNSVYRIGLIVGSSKAYYSGLMTTANNGGVIQYNKIDSVGYNGILIKGTYAKIQNNYINHTCLILNDGGGIYTASTNLGMQIDHNIILNTIGNYDGGNTPISISEGIYLDEYANGITVSNNTSGYNGYSGIKLHKAHTNKIEGNHCFANRITGIYMLNSSTSAATLYENEIQNNQFVAKNGQRAFMIKDMFNSSPSGLGHLDYNIYARPVSDTQVFSNYFGAWVYRTLSQWQSFSGYDANSQGSPYSVVSDDSLILVYNADKVANYITLPFNIKTLDGTHYSGSVYLQPYTSKIGFYAGEIVTNQNSVIFQSGNVHIYPNPTGNEVTIQFSALPERGTKIEITDITGKVIISQMVRSAFEVLDIQSQPAGIYFVKTIFQNVYNIQKLFIN
jgi:parallel beta-helix repeat protein